MNLFDHALDALLCRSQSQAGLARCSRVHSSEREAQEVELAFRDLADLCLVLVHCQLQLTHDFAQAMQRRFGVAPPAQDHEVIGIGDKASAKTLLKTELLPPQHKPAHVDDGTVAAPTHWSFGQLCTLAATPSPASYFRESGLPTPIIADCLNYNLRFTRGVEDVKLLVSGQDAGFELRAATGPRYGRIWNADVVDA